MKVRNCLQRDAAAADERQDEVRIRRKTARRMRQRAITAGFARVPYHIGVITARRRGELQGQAAISHGGENNLLVVTHDL